MGCAADFLDGGPLGFDYGLWVCGCRGAGGGAVVGVSEGDVVEGREG